MSRTGATWWSSLFLRSLERLGMSAPLQHGLALYRKNRVQAIDIRSSVVSSTVLSDDGEEMFRCEIHFEPFSDMEWQESLERLAFTDLAAAALLTTGRMPPQIENVFAPSRRRLLPQASTDLEFYCDCGERSPLCKHLAATAYTLAERLDLDPWLLFLLRGRSADEVKSALHSLWEQDDESRSESPSQPNSVETEESSLESEGVDQFWAHQLRERIMFSPPPQAASSLTIERMATPEPKIDSETWVRALGEIYSGVTESAKELL